MKRTYIAIACLSLLLLSQGAFAQDAKIGLLNALQALFNSDAAKVVQEELEQEFSIDEERAQELTEQLGALQEEYQQNEAVMSEEEIRRMNSNAQDLMVQLQLIQEGNDGWVVNYNPSDYDDLLRDELNRVPLNSGRAPGIETCLFQGARAPGIDSEL